mgnify:CR=1 FL=1
MNKKEIGRRLTGMTMAVLLTGTMAGCAASDTPSDTASGGTSAVSGPVTVSIGRQTLQNVTFPNGDTYEDNAYIRMAEKELNIDIVDAFEATGDDYDRQVSLALSAGDIPDMIVDGKTGFLCRPQDTENLREKLDRLLADPVLCRTLGENARRKAEEEFSIESNIEQLLKIYRGLVGGG